jgi:leucyl-tRNA synthetase
MLEYKPEEIEKKWQKKWLKNKTYQTSNNYKLPKYYVLDMFPYPSGEGLHVGHPLGYIATDIVSRYKKNLGFNVLHPMGYDSFGLPAEQYAIQTGKHPALTTEINIKRYRQQLDRLGFSYDWNREIKTSDPKFYKWTQKFFIMMFNSWYDNKRNKAKKITSLIEKFNQSGTKDVNASVTKKHSFSSDDWKSFNEVKREEVLMNYRVAYLSEGTVNWCPKLGTVLANDEVKDGLSERGGYVVEQKIMKQWSIRISAYAERLLKGLEQVEFSKSLKEQQRNWIGKSNGATVTFKTQNNIDIHVSNLVVKT